MRKVIASFTVVMLALAWVVSSWGQALGPCFNYDKKGNAYPVTCQLTGSYVSAVPRNDAPAHCEGLCCVMAICDLQFLGSCLGIPKIQGLLSCSIFGSTNHIASYDRKTKTGIYYTASAEASAQWACTTTAFGGNSRVTSEIIGMSGPACGVRSFIHFQGFDAGNMTNAQIEYRAEAYCDSTNKQFQYVQTPVTGPVPPGLVQVPWGTPLLIPC